MNYRQTLIQEYARLLREYENSCWNIERQITSSSALGHDLRKEIAGARNFIKANKKATFLSIETLEGMIVLIQDSISHLNRHIDERTYDVYKVHFDRILNHRKK